MADAIEEHYQIPLSSGEALAVLAGLRALHRALSREEVVLELDPAALAVAAARIAAEIPEFISDKADRLSQTISAAFDDIAERAKTVSSGKVVPEIPVRRRRRSPAARRRREWPSGPMPLPEALRLLNSAREQSVPVEIQYYVRGRDEWTERTVDIEDVYEDNGSWYLEGYCYLREEDRLFRVDQIGGVHLQGAGDR